MSPMGKFDQISFFMGSWCFCNALDSFLLDCSMQLINCKQKTKPCQQDVEMTQSMQVNGIFSEINFIYVVLRSRRSLQIWNKLHQILFGVV